MFSQVVIWGYPLYSHTHSQIHNGFQRAFQSLGHQVFWVPVKVDAPHERFPLEFDPGVKNTCYVVSGGGVDNDIPINSHSYYILHFCDDQKQKDTKHLKVQCWFDLCTSEPRININSYSFLQKQTYFMPWATDLLPHEIDSVIKEYPPIFEKQKESDKVNFTGQIEQEPWKVVSQFCKQKNLNFTALGGYGLRNVSIEENQKRIQESRIAPAFQSQVQIDRKQIPCRIFKNISYGHFGITNNPEVAKLFPRPIVYHSNWQEALKLAVNSPRNIQDELTNIEQIRDHHTYVKRVQDIQTCFQLLYKNVDAESIQ